MQEVNFYLRDSKSAEKTGLILYFTYNKCRIKVCTIARIKPSNWKQEKQKAFPKDDFAEFNTSLSNKKSLILNAYTKYLNENNQQEPSQGKIKNIILDILNKSNEISENKDLDLLSFTELFISESEMGKRLNDKGAPVSPNTIKVYKTFKKNLLAFKQKKKWNDLNFNTIDLAFFEEFKDYMTFDLRYTTNSLSKHIRILKTITNEAISRNFDCKPLVGKRFMAKNEVADTVYLNKSELQTLYELDLSEAPRLDKVRDLFLVGCWTGLRFSDFSDISPKCIKGDFLTIKTQKTGKEVIIPIHDYVRKIMNKYNGMTENSLPPNISNQKMNSYIKEVCEKAGFVEPISISFTKAGKLVHKQVKKHELISSHTARRSFATNMYLAGFPTISIMAITTHTTESSFMKYIRVTPKEHAMKLQEHWRSQPLMMVV